MKKSVQRVVVLRELRQEKLHREVTVRQLVAGRPHRSHAACAENALQSVLSRDKLAGDHAVPLLTELTPRLLALHRPPGESAEHSDSPSSRKSIDVASRIPGSEVTTAEVLGIVA